MDNVTELRANTRTPITANETVSIAAQGVIIKNVGTATVTLNNHYTMQAGETLPLGVTNDRNEIIVMDVTFIFAGVGTKRVEIFELISNEPKFVNYKRQ